MPRESGVLVDICCDFYFSRGNMPFYEEVDSNEQNEGTGGLLMKTQEASRRKTRLCYRRSHRCLCFFTLSSHKVHVLSLFLNAATFVAAVVLMYSRQLNQSDNESMLVMIQVTMISIKNVIFFISITRDFHFSQLRILMNIIF